MINPLLACPIVVAMCFANGDMAVGMLFLSAWAACLYESVQDWLFA